jgi:ubiquinone biosynthesis protein
LRVNCRVLRRIAEGNLGRLQAPALEDLAYRINRKLRRLTDAIAAAALLIGGAMLVSAPRDAGWHHVVGEVMVAAGIISTLLVGMAAFHRDRGRDGRR